MADPLHLKVCPACRTAIAEAALLCPECGAAQEAEPPPGEPVPEDVFDVEHMFETMRGAFAGERGARRTMAGMGARQVLQSRIGCLATFLVVFFGIPVLLGLLLGDALGALAVMLLVVGVAGLVMTGILVWLLLPTRRRPPA
jgi:predicted anti-sigma-YlaC factor YlaD